MNGIIYVIYLALSLYAWIIVARMLLSWVQLRPGGTAYKVNKVLVDVTEPYLAPFRRLIPMARIGAMGMDFSPVVALLVLFIVMQVLARL
jgi:YggT family protein